MISHVDAYQSLGLGILLNKSIQNPLVFKSDFIFKIIEPFESELTGSRLSSLSTFLGLKIDSPPLSVNFQGLFTSIFTCPDKEILFA